MFFNFLSFNHIKLIIPEFFLLSSIFSILLFGCFLGLSKNFFFPLLNFVINNILVLILFFLIFLVINNPIPVALIFNGIFVIDNASSFAKISIALFSICCLLISFSFVKIYKINNFEFFIVIGLSVLGLNILICSADFLLAYIALELQSFCFYILAAFKKNSAYSTESGLKYFLLGSFSSTIMLFSISVIYALFGTTNFLLLNLLIFDNNNISFLAVISFVLIFTGLLFKLSAAPFHFWAPDVYEGSPTNSTVFFAVVPKISVLILTVRVFVIFSNNSNFFSSLFLFCSVLSIVVGSFITLKQKRLKKLIAFSSINHVGYILLGVSLLTIESTSAVFFYIITYSITSLALWGSLSFLKTENKNRYRTFNIADLGAMIKINPFLCFIFSTCLFSMAGIPPLVGFYAKLNIFQSAINAGFIVVACFIVLTSIVSTFYYIRLVKSAFFENSAKKWFFFFKITKKHALITVLSFFLVFLLFFNPFVLNLISYKIALSIIF
jgi:proton-translocating NADH-quinone oxidoreductase chain N